MRTILFILCACCLATGCGDTAQPLKPSPLHSARINSKQCASDCCRRKHWPVTHSVRKSKLHPH